CGAIEPAAPPAGMLLSHGQRDRPNSPLALRRSSPLTRSSPSPDMHSLVGRQVQLVAGLDAEGGVPGIYVAHDSVDAGFARAVGIGHHLIAHGFVAVERPPDLCPAEKEALVR